MFKIKVFLYDSTQESNGYRGTDFSQYVLQGQEYTEDVTQVLDVDELTLAGISQKESFTPATKFVIDIVEVTENVEINKITLHKCVSDDTVSQPILSDDTYFEHHISLIEPSVVAQQRLVDNIATTYKLKDVTLQEVPAYPDTITTINLKPRAKLTDVSFESTLVSQSFVTKMYKNILGKRFVLSGDLQFRTPSGEIVNSLYNNIEKFATGDSTSPYKATFIIPKMSIQLGSGSGYYHSGYASLSCMITEYDPNGENPSPNPITRNIISNSSLTGNKYIHPGVDEVLSNSWLLESVVPKSGTEASYAYYKKYTETTASDPNYEIEVPLNVDKQYTLTISLYQFSDNIPSTLGWVRKFTSNQPTYYLSCYTSGASFTSMSGYSFIGNTGVAEYNPINQYMIAQNTSGSANFITYGVDTGTIVYAHATPYSALALLQKAIINSSLCEKQDGVYIADVNNSKLPYYIDEAYTDKLSATQIIENFYNQKNLWEVMVEVGNYIHAIPELKFGSDDRFIITFNELGRTDEQVDKGKTGTKVSIFNSRSVEDYISATSSYITNMVQLGGYIEEWITPKTTDEQLLVYNDTAELLLSKPIIELLSIQVRRNSDGAIADLTDYIYEENVYKTLSIDYEVIPNRGIAMYYSLGDNKITGGQYQLPQANDNIYTQYAFKKIIYCAFNSYPVIAPAPVDEYWTNIKISDYTFYVRYRTKDSVRQTHIRPDLRKYLLNTKYDRYPEHNQFNNQTDVVVDSIKFGNNMFGKLIKTGNNSYEIWEWHDKLSEIKHKGELYRINSELYYVAKVTHYVYSTYILSKISYSKDYNELSNIIGIPSEPRFYEISEQSLINREFAINDVIYLTDTPDDLEYKSNYMFNYDHLADLILSSETDFAKYAVTVFKGDKDVNKYDQTVGERDTYIEVLNPINAYSSENTLTYEWDMLDNYSAGDQIVDTDKTEYTSLKAVRYTDIYGKAPLLDFYIIENLNADPTASEIKLLPQSLISTKKGDTRPFIGEYDILATNVKDYDTNYNGRGIGLLKDCREAISVNYNLQMATSSDTFVLSPFVYLPQKKNLKLVLLTTEVNKLSTGYIDNSAIILPIDTNGIEFTSKYFDFKPTLTMTENSWDASKKVCSQFSIDLASILAGVNEKHFTGNDNKYQRVKSIAVLCDVSLNPGTDDAVAPTIPYKTQFVIARNIPDFWTKDEATTTWYFGSPKKDNVFKNKQ